jgi:hypothetical protein
MSPKKASDYSPAAHRAVQIAEQQADQLPCVCPANNLLYVFLLEVRSMRVTEAQNRGQDPYSDNLNRNLKISLDNLVEHPFRVYDAKSAQEVKGIGSAVANVKFFFFTASLLFYFIISLCSYPYLLFILKSTCCRSFETTYLVTTHKMNPMITNNNN